MLEFVDAKASEHSTNNRIIISQDRSTRVGASETHEHADYHETAIEKFGYRIRNAKGENILAFSRSANLHISIIHFKCNTCTVFRDFTSNCGLHQIDHFLVDQNFFTDTSDYFRTSLNTVSEESRLLLKLNVKCNRKIHKKITSEKILCQEISHLLPFVKLYARLVKKFLKLKNQMVRVSVK